MIDQSAFRAGLLDPEHPVPEGLTDGANNPAGRRFDVYRNNVTLSLIDAMKSAFPLVEKLLGAANFDSLAAVFVREHPPQSPLMMFYGAEFPAFLDQFTPLSHIGYLSDAARLDLGLRHAYHAADVPAFDAAVLQNLNPDALMDATMTLAPATRTIQSDWPLFDIWRYNQDTSTDKPRAIAQDVLITRPEFDPTPHELPKGAAQWLEALRSGATFGAAHDAICNKHPDFDLAASLGIALSTQAFAALHHKDLP
ncbi:MAG: DNA-binding domain-containing protein [Sulfitobacter sp.]